MLMRLALLLPLAALVTGCHDNDRPRTPDLAYPPASASTATAAAAASATAPPTTTATPTADAPAKPWMTDAELGELISSLSEKTGDFPSDNFVSNETSLLDVAPVLSRDTLRGRAYVGVGPEQNLTYARLMRASVAYVVDIRRQNMLELLAMRAAMEPSETRAAFLSRWTSRPDVSGKLGEAATMDDIAKAIGQTPADPSLTSGLVDATVRLMTRLGVSGERGDEQGIKTVVDAFAKKGLELSYSMKGSGRKYPPLRELLSAKGPDGVAGSFAATEESYAEVRRMMTDNRIVPVVGDFSGATALSGVAQDMRKRGAQLGVFYVSNVEQYLFEGDSYARFVRNVRAFPSDDASVFIRVWFDQGRPHPKQRAGHRTTSMAMSMGGFLARWETKPYRSFWEVATDDALMLHEPGR